MVLALYVGCRTGHGGANALNLPSKTVSRGAVTSVGFDDGIDCASANAWTIDFCNYMKNGSTVYSACATLAAKSTYIGTGLDTYVICGNLYSTIAE